MLDKESQTPEAAAVWSDGIDGTCSALRFQALGIIGRTVEFGGKGVQCRDAGRLH